MIKRPETTITLIILIVLAMGWASGKLQKILSAAFGGEK